jgi:hypothetical protein
MHRLQLKFNAHLPEANVPAEPDGYARSQSVLLMRLN